MRKVSKRMKKGTAFLLASAMIATGMPWQELTVRAEDSGGEEPWIATPYTKEDGTVVEGLEEAIQGKEHWLETAEELPAKAEEKDGVLTVSNGIITREFKIPKKGETDFGTQRYYNEYIEKELLEDESKPDVYLGLYDESYNEVYDDTGCTTKVDPLTSMDVAIIPDGAIKSDPDYYFVGGSGTTENTFVFDGYDIQEECEKPFEWTPNEKYGDPAAKEWPPEGIHLKFHFSAPKDFPEVYQGVKVTVIYEMYDNLPAMKKRVEVTNSGEKEIMIGRIAPEVLNGNDNLDELLTVETSYTCGDQSAIPVNVPLSCKCDEEKVDSPFRELAEMNHSCYDVGPAYDLSKDEKFSSFDTYELVHSTYWFELQMRERMGMYRTLFPWITDNPLTFHNVEALTKEKIDHAADAGFEMIIQSYSAPDQSGQMLSRDPVVLNRYKELIDYAHSKGVDIGIYQAQYQRNQYKGGAEYGTNGLGRWGTWCMASAAFDDYWDNFKYFVEYTGLDAVEIDGPYPGSFCNNGHSHVDKDKETDPNPNGIDKTTGDASKYEVHHGFFDSQVKQWENAVRMLCKMFRDMGVYIKVPAWYYVNGGNKCGIGYEEAAWSQPREEQLLYGRQLIHNASYARSMSMSWSHVPFSNYHGGGSAAAFQPFKDHMEDYNWVMAQYLGNGVASDFRGNALCDEETRDICNKWVDFYQRYRGIVNSDLVHITQAECKDGDRTRGTKMDTLYHVNADNPGEKGLLWVYNQTDEERTETITVPMYYTGLTDMNYPPVPLKNSLGKNVHSYGTYPPNYDWLPKEEGNYRQSDVTGNITGTASFVKEGVKIENIEIDSNGNAQLTVTLAPMSFTYYTIYDENEVPDVTLDIGKVNNVKAENVTEHSVDLTWDKEVDVKLTEDGEVNDNPAVTIDGYNIYRDGEKVASIMTNSWTDADVKEGTEYTYTIKAIVSGIEGKASDELKVTTLADEVKPTVVAATVKSDTEIFVLFSEKVDAATAQAVANYTLNKNGKVLTAKIAEDSDGTAVMLTTESLKPMESYELTIANIKDTSKNENVIDETKVEVTYGYLAHYAMDSVENDTIKEDMSGKDAKTSNVNFALGTGKDGSAIFNASSNAYADLGVSPFKGMDTYSMNMFVRPTSLEGTQALMSAGQEEIKENDFGLYMNDGKVTFKTSNSAGDVAVELTSEKSLTKDAWNQVAIVREGENFKLYVNGNMEAQQKVAGIGTFDSLNSLYLGAMTNHAGGDRTAFFDGKMDEVALYNVAVSDEQVARMSNEYLGRYDNARPVIYLDMDEVTDGKVINKADGKEYAFNGLVEQVEGENGIKGLKFNGNDNYINLGNKYQVDGEFTVSAWVNVATTGDNRNHKIFGRGYTTHAEGEFYVAIRNEGYNIAVSNANGEGSGNLYDFNGVNYIPVNKWAHLVVTCDGNTIKVYKNGELHEKTGNASGLNLAGNEKDLLVGAGWNSSGTGLQGDHVFKGAMDEVYLYDTVLTEEEIQALQTPGQVNKAELQVLYDANKDKANDNYTEGSWAEFTQALTNAKAMLEKNDAAQWEVDDAYWTLKEAVENLEQKPSSGVSKKTLEYFLNKAKEHVANGDVYNCIESVKKLFEEAIAEGEAVMADANATREEVTNATKKLVQAIQSLGMEAGDKTDLEMAIELGDMINENLDNYVESGKQEFIDALENAKTVYGNGDAFQKEIEEAYNMLLDGMANLRLKADKSVLDDLLDSVKKLDLSKYTEESVNVFKKAVAYANEVMEDETLSVDEQNKVDGAVESLKDAYGKLVAKADTDEETDSDKNTGTDENNSSNGGKTENTNKEEKTDNSKEKQAPKTGDTAPIASAGMLLASALAVLGVQKRRTK